MICFAGYSDKIIEFAKTWLGILKECCEKGFNKTVIMNGIEKKKTKYANSNIDVENHALNNRMNFLISSSRHDSLMEKVLAEKIKDASTFYPGKFLKEKVLDQITSIQVLVMGNTTKESAKQFCEGTIAKVFKTTKSNNIGFEVGHIPTGQQFYWDSVSPKQGNEQANTDADINPDEDGVESSNADDEQSDEDEEKDERKEDNNFIEVYFQPPD